MGLPIVCCIIKSENKCMTFYWGKRTAQQVLIGTIIKNFMTYSVEWHSCSPNQNGHPHSCFRDLHHRSRRAGLKQRQGLAALSLHLHPLIVISQHSHLHSFLCPVLQFIITTIIRILSQIGQIPLFVIGEPNVNVLGHKLVSLLHLSKIDFYFVFI